MSSEGFSVEFVPLQPDPDATSPEGGWTHVLLWLENHPPDSRIPQFFTGGLFGGDLAQEPLDGILVQLDSDILGNEFLWCLCKESAWPHRGKSGSRRAAGEGSAPCLVAGGAVSENDLC